MTNSRERQVGMVIGSIHDEGQWRYVSLKEKRVRNEAEGSEGCFFREVGILQTFDNIIKIVDPFLVKRLHSHFFFNVRHKGLNSWACWTPDYRIITI